ncbi:MAG: trypsin-like peptidase domain-containing protein [Planctomycetia bacterium]|nr:trypsin-like peptidase domain-containing protein [Planctomycetia bacterium]
MVSMQIAALVMALSSGGETVLLDFHAPWCAPCRSMEGTLAELEQAGYPVRKVNIDRQRDLATQYHVESIPCFVLLVDGKEVGRVTGAVRRAELLDLFSKGGFRSGQGGIENARAQSPDPPLRSIALPGELDRNPLTASRSADSRSADPRGLATKPAPEPPASLQDLIRASVRLTIQDPQGTSYGSGTLIDSRQGEALVLTCGHIFRDSQGKGQITVDLFGPRAPQKVPGRLVSYDLKSDIGLVSIRPGVPLHVAQVAPAGQPIARGDKVISVGCNNGGPATALETKITAINKFGGPPNLEIAGLPVQGRSGGGLFTSDGLVIGVCNAADPADNEGLYAALAAIHGQLDQAGLATVYQNRRTQPEPELAGTAQVPNMPARMPKPKYATQGPARGLSAAQSASQADPPGGLSDAERAALAEMRQRGDSAEVICVVRSLSNPQAKSEVIMLDRASSAFLKQLAADREAQEARHLTSLKVRPQILESPVPGGPRERGRLDPAPLDSKLR